MASEQLIKKFEVKLGQFLGESGYWPNLQGHDGIWGQKYQEVEDILINKILPQLNTPEDEHGRHFMKKPTGKYEMLGWSVRSWEVDEGTYSRAQCGSDHTETLHFLARA